MAVTLTEDVDSREIEADREGNLLRAVLRYTLTGTSDDATALTLAANSISETFNGLYREGLDLDPDWVDTTTTRGRWRIEVRYAAHIAPKIGEQRVILRYGSESVHMTHARSVVQKYPASAPDFKGAIDPGADGSVGGLDVPFPVVGATILRTMASSAVTQAYLETVEGLNQRVNSDALDIVEKTFDEAGVLHSTKLMACQAGEVRLVGFEKAERDTTGVVTLTYELAISRNVTGESLGDLTGIAKKGWEYLSAFSRQAKDATNPALITKPEAAYVLAVFKTGAFSALGIA